ncbi:MAG TPA: hypothetical protein VGG42_18320 [Acidobacteriaceae bacterium]|jgi:hypothetical protein
MAISQKPNQTPSTPPQGDSVSDKTGRIPTNNPGTPLKPSTDTVADRTGR